MTKKSEAVGKPRERIENFAYLIVLYFIFLPTLYSLSNKTKETAYYYSH